MKGSKMRALKIFFIVDCSLALWNAAFLCRSLAIGSNFWWISLIGVAIASCSALYSLKAMRKLKRLKWITALMQAEQKYYDEYIAKRTAEAGKEAFDRLHSPDLPREPKRRESGEKCTKRLIKLALHHPKARVRKKNANRIIKMQGKEKKCK